MLGSVQGKGGQRSARGGGPDHDLKSLPADRGLARARRGFGGDTAAAGAEMKKREGKSN